MAITSFPWNQANTLAQDFIIPQIRENIFVSNAFYYRARGNLKEFPGGRSIVQPLVWKPEGGGGGWFSGADKLDATIRDPIQAAQWVPKNAYVPISIDWEEEQVNAGPTKVLDLMTVKGEIARRTIVDLVGTDLFNDGTDGKRVTGLRYALRPFTGTAPGALPSQTYGGILRQGRYDGSDGGTQANNWWIHQGDNTPITLSATVNVLNPSGAFTGIGGMWAKIGLASGKRPTMILSNWGSYTSFHNALVLNERYGRPMQNSDLAKAGFENVMYKNAPWVVDERAPRVGATKLESIYLINEDTVRLVVQTGADMMYEPFRKPFDQMVRVAYILWRGELIVVEPRANGVFDQIRCDGIS